MNSTLSEIESRIEQAEKKLDDIEDAAGSDFIPEKSSEWMDVYRKKIQLDARFFLAVNEGREIQFNEDKTQFRVVTKENRGKKFW
jgi:hypothetical protein